MAADVGYMFRALNDSQKYHKSYKNGVPSTLITRDLLGESFSDVSNDSRELDLDSQVPAGWEKRLDLKSGKICLEPNPSVTKPIKRQLKASPLKSPNYNLCTYQSVCTLDKVKSALDREKQEQLMRRKFFFRRSSKSPSSSVSCSSTNVLTLGSESDEKSTSSMLSLQMDGSLKMCAAGCANCLMYVMISNENPKCPNCNSMVELPVTTTKKPRIDLDLNLNLFS